MNTKRLDEHFLAEFSDYNFSLLIEKKIGLVGSARFKEAFFKIESILQILHQKLVAICSLDGLLHKSKFSSEEWEALQSICLEKLKDQDALLVLDLDNYIGDHTSEEIHYFRENLKKPIYYLSRLHTND
ncbi:MAG: hypothetical protein EU544_02420 [Promethearchaeota archaeon]|nr:MAG: hypothetical protein EU544_02420 [Candidatus Lokiarchaeota archaeon]